MLDAEPKEDVQVIQILNEIEILPVNNSETVLKEQLCKEMLNKINENVNYLHLQTIKNDLKENQPEVDVEYKVTKGENNGSSIENVEIKKKIKQENMNEIQDSCIKIQNNHLTVINESNANSPFISIKNDQQWNDNDSTQCPIDVHQLIKSVSVVDYSSPNYYSNQEEERELLKKYLSESALKHHIKPVVKIDLNKRFYNDRIYPMCSKIRGYCLMINNVDFKIYEQRKGSDLEAEYLKEIFNQLGFEVLYYRNKTTSAMLECFKNLVKRDELEQHDTFVSIILTHGDDGRILIGTDASRLKMDSFLHYFTNSNCPKLANKPKLFFIQACRGNSHDFGIYDKTTVSDAAPIKTSVSKIRKELKDPNRLNDVLIVNSTLDGFVSLRNEISGSWFGDALGTALCENSKDLEIQKLLLNVNRKIIEREKGDVQQAIECNFIGFRKSFYFNPGHIFEKDSIK